MYGKLEAQRLNGRNRCRHSSSRCLLSRVASKLRRTCFSHMLTLLIPTCHVLTSDQKPTWRAGEDFESPHAGTSTSASERQYTPYAKAKPSGVRPKHLSIELGSSDSSGRGRRS